MINEVKNGCLPVSKAVANIFYDQTCGEYAGHMAMVPNNPLTRSVFLCHKDETAFVKDKNIFAEFLRQVADHLENN